MKKKPDISNENAIYLWQNYPNNQKVRNLAMKAILKNNSGVIAQGALHIENKGYNWQDYQQETAMLMMKPMDKFDPAIGYKFMTYMIHYLRASINLFRIKAPTVYRSRVVKQENGKKKAEIIPAHIISLNEPIKGHKSIEYQDVLKDETEEKNDFAPYVKAILENLDHKERVIIKTYFGIGTSDNLNLTDAAGRLGISRERARQIKEKAIRKLKKHCKLETAKGTAIYKEMEQFFKTGDE